MKRLGMILLLVAVLGLQTLAVVLIFKALPLPLALTGMMPFVYGGVTLTGYLLEELFELADDVKRKQTTKKRYGNRGNKGTIEAHRGAQDDM